MLFKRFLAISFLLGRLWADGFSPQELVLTPGGQIAVGDVQPGQALLGVNPETGEVEPCQVAAVYWLHDWPTVNLQLDEGSIQCAANQVLLNSDGYWVLASDLTAGDRLRREDGSSVAIHGISLETAYADAVAFAVEPHHTLCVGPQGIVAHNILFVVPLVTWVIGSEVVFLSLSTLTITAASALAYWGMSSATDSFNNRRWGSGGPGPSDILLDRTRSSDYGDDGLSPFGTGRPPTSSGGRPPQVPIPVPVSSQPSKRYDPPPPRNAKHGKDARGDISAAPKDGQTALDRALPDPRAPNSEKLTGWSSGQFVEFQETLPNLYHGYVIPWRGVPQPVRKAWQEAGIVTAGGRFIGQS